MIKTEILADLHTHTVKSGHAYSTLEENVCSGGGNEVYFVAITDHIYNDGTEINKLNEAAYFTGLSGVEPDGCVCMIGGIEGNLFQKLDMKPNTIKEINQSLKWRLIGIHSWFIGCNTNLKITDVPKYFSDTLRDSKGCKVGLTEQIVPTAFAHIERELECFTHTDDIDKDIKEALVDIVDVAVRNGIFLEINESSISRGQEMRDRMKFWIKYAVSRHAKFCFGSDAHSSERVGRFWDSAISLMR